jgi:hypothetical protein
MPLLCLGLEKAYIENIDIAPGILFNEDSSCTVLLRLAYITVVLYAPFYR